MIVTAERHFLSKSLIVLWFRRTAPCLATSAWQCLLSGRSCYPDLPNTVYTQLSILRHARPSCPVSKHWGFHDVYSVYIGVSFNKTSMNVGSLRNWWIRLDLGPQLGTLGILDHFDPCKVYLCYYGFLCSVQTNECQKPRTQSALNIMIQHRFVVAIRSVSENPSDICVCVLKNDKWNNWLLGQQNQ